MNRIRRLLRSLAWWILANVQAQPDEIDRALIGAFADCGLNAEHYADDYNVRNVGKFYDVLVMSAHRLGNPLQTMGDVKRLLQ